MSVFRIEPYPPDVRVLAEWDHRGARRGGVIASVLGFALACFAYASDNSVLAGLSLLVLFLGVAFAATRSRAVLWWMGERQCLLVREGPFKRSTTVVPFASISRIEIEVKKVRIGSGESEADATRHSLSAETRDGWRFDLTVPSLHDDLSIVVPLYLMDLRDRLRGEADLEGQ